MHDAERVQVLEAMQQLLDEVARLLLRVAASLVQLEE